MTLVRDYIEAGTGRLTVDPSEGSERRKASISRRLRIDSNQHDSDVVEHVFSIYETETSRRQLARYVKAAKALNPLKRIADRLAIAYRIPPLREIEDDDEATEKLNRLYREAKMHALAHKIGRTAFLAGVVHVMPRVKSNGKLKLDVIVPHISDVILDQEDEDEAAILVYDTNTVPGATRVAVDAEAFTYFDARKHIVSVVPHAYGRVPWAEFRTEDAPPGDYWGWARGEPLEATTLEICRIIAAMGWTRKDFSRKLLTLFSEDLSKIPEGQTAEGVFTGAANPTEIQMQALDVNVSPEDFLKEARAHLEHAVESYGVPLEVIDMPEKTFEHPGRHSQVLSEVRDQQVEHLVLGERDLAVAIATVATAAGHPDAIDPELVAEKFAVTFPPLTAHDLPEQRQKNYEGWLMLGQMSHVDIKMRELPGLSRKRARELVKQAIDERNEFNELLASRNASLDPRTEAYSTTQAQGRAGGATKALNEQRREDADETA